MHVSYEEDTCVSYEPRCAQCASVRLGPSQSVVLAFVMSCKTLRSSFFLGRTHFALCTGLGGVKRPGQKTF